MCIFHPKLFLRNPQNFTTELLYVKWSVPKCWKLNIKQYFIDLRLVLNTKNILYKERFLLQFHISFFRYTTMNCVLLYVLLAYLCAYSSLAPCYNYVKFIALLVFILLLLLWCSVLCACMCFAFRYIICPICTNGTILVISQT